MDDEASNGRTNGVLERFNISAISLEDAKALGLKLIAERSVFVSAYEDNFEQETVTFNLCEH